MKKFIALIVAVLAVVTLASATVRADLVTQYGVNVNDNSPWVDTGLFELFNDYFAEQLLTPHTSSNQLFNDRGVSPNTLWMTSGSQLVGAFKDADMGHIMRMVDNTTGATVGQIADLTERNFAGGITDLAGQYVTDIPDGLNVSFELDAFWNGNLLFTWSSSLGENVDGVAHMLALNITDLYNDKHGANYDSVFMFAWEDLHLTGGGYPQSDMDYQDFVLIMTNVRPMDTHVIPEPATLAILGLGLAGLGFARRRIRK